MVSVGWLDDPAKIKRKKIQCLLGRTCSSDCHRIHLGLDSLPLALLLLKNLGIESRSAFMPHLLKVEKSVKFRFQAEKNAH